MQKSNPTAHELFIARCTPQPSHISESFRWIQSILPSIKTELNLLNKHIEPVYQISEKELKTILRYFFQFMNSVFHQKNFFDKKEIGTNHSAVYFKNEKDQHCLFIKPNVKNNPVTRPYHRLFAQGSQKKIKKVGLLITFSNGLDLISCSQYASFSKTTEGLKNEQLKQEWDVNAKRNGFFPVSFEDAQKRQRHLYITPFHGEPIDLFWNRLFLVGKLMCVQSIITDAKKFNVNDIKIVNTMCKISAQGVPVVKLIDGNDEHVAYTHTPYSTPYQNRNGVLVQSKKEQEHLSETISKQKEILQDFQSLFDFTEEKWPLFYQGKISLEERTTLVKNFISSLKYSQELGHFFEKVDPRQSQIQLKSFISKFELDIKRLEYLATPATEQEITETRIFSLAVLFWQLINIERAMDPRAIYCISLFSSTKLTPNACKQHRKLWCLQKDGVTETPLTEIVLKAYERKLSYDELYEAVCTRLYLDEGLPAPTFNDD